MVDTLSKAERSELMSRIRSTDSKPEMSLRRLVHGMGYRYRLHVRELPGKPDMVFPARRAVISMHGCFWHLHGRCRLARMPKSRVKFWRAKLEANKRRDQRNRRKLRALGWRVFVVWECQLTDLDRVALKVRNFLEQD